MSGEMMVVGVIGQKGGGGKTTTSLGLAVAAAEQGKASVVIDIDQQANSAKWRDRRKTDNVAVIGTLQSRIKQTLETARTHGADYVVIDSPGHNDSAAMETVRASNIVILPVEAQMFHFEPLPAMRDLIPAAGDSRPAGEGRSTPGHGSILTSAPAYGSYKSAAERTRKGRRSTSTT